MSIDWAKLVIDGRAKDFGIPWNNKELNAVVKLGIPADFVRLGCLTKEDYEEKKAQYEKEAEPLILKDRQELLMMVHQMGIAATSDATKESLIRALENGGYKPEKKKVFGSKKSKDKTKK